MLHFCTKIGKKAVYLQPITFAKTCKTSDGYSCARLLVFLSFRVQIYKLIWKLKTILGNFG